MVNLFAKTFGLVSSYMLNSKTEFDYSIIGQMASVLDVGEGAPLNVGIIEQSKFRRYNNGMIE